MPVRLGGVNLPDKLMDALEAGSLVIFAGAGVSMGPPSNLPDFGDLTRRVAQGSGLGQEPHEPFDRFLGRLERQGIKVHDRTQETIDDPLSLPSDTHRVILGVFSEPGRIRIVTTNFDSHFENVWPDVCPGTPVHRYCAPALPLGRDFTGIVHVHGSVTEPPRRMVLTDGDFGLAYVTEGWATRFLADLFEHFTVLFVGYSHEDIMVDYLSRALPDAQVGGRFALLAAGHDANRWRSRGVEPVFYENADGVHSEVPALFREWAQTNGMSLAQHSQKMRDLVLEPPSEVGDDVEYVRDAFRKRESNVQRAKIAAFLEYAGSANWLNWANRENLLDSLFAPSATYGQEHADLAWWVARKSAVQRPEDVLAIISEHGGNLSPVFWTAIAQTLHACDHLDPSVLRAWVPILTAQEPSNSHDFLAYLILKCSLPEATDVVLHLIGHLVQPRPKLEGSRRAGGSPRITAELTGDCHWIQEAWKNVLRPNLRDLAVSLATLFTASLEQAHRLQMVGPGSPFDSISFSRSAVEPHEQDARDHSGFGVLIDGLREIADWARVNDPSLAGSLFRLWSHSSVPIMRRVAIYLLTDLDDVTPQAKVQWVIERYAVGDQSIAHETYRLLASHFREASLEQQERLVEQAHAMAESTGPEFRDYRLFNLMHWLAEAHPDSEPVRAALAEVLERNPQFKPRKYPDLDAWFEVGVWGGERSPISEKEVRRLPARDLLKRVSGESEAREALLETVAVAVRQDLEWSLCLFVDLTCQDVVCPSAVALAAAVMAGWEKADMPPKDRERALRALEGIPDAGPWTREVSRLLGEWAASSEGFLTPEAWQAARTLAERLWGHAEAEDWVTELSDHGWLLLAINHSAGHLVLFWLNCISMIRKLDPEPGWHIPDDVRTHLQAMCGSTTRGGTAARAVLLSHVSFLFQADEDWTLERLLPLLEPGSPFSEEAWDGLVSHSRRPASLWQVLLPAYRKLLANPGQLRQPMRKPFVGHLAFLCVTGDEDPVRSGLIYECLRAFSPEERAQFAASLASSFAQLSPVAVKETWARWIDHYIHSRSQGVPQPLDAREYAEMCEWPLSLTEVFCEVVAGVERLPRLVLDPDLSSVAHRLVKTALPENRPDCLLRLLIVILKSTPDRLIWSAGDLKTVLARTLKAGADKALARSACDELIRLGHADAVSLLRNG